ncbi:MAG: DUF4912 domain-containing protein [Cyanobacteria bacterium REEB459]|nr:DUF4912 domain-containing protein [Cyanobacteria bacterium REEB459]
MHKILPDDQRYPYSQPRYFVYKGTLGPAAAAFLGYATSSSATEALATLDPAKAAAIAANLKAAPPSAVSPAPIPSPVPVPGPTPEARGGLAWWWLLPLAGAGALGAAAWAAGRKSGTAVAPLESPLPDATLPAVPPAGGGAALDIYATANPEDITAAEATPELAVQPPDVNLPPVALGALGAAGLAAGAAASLAGTEGQATPEPEAPPEPAAQAAALNLPTAALGALGAAGLAAGAAASLASTEDQSAIEAAKFNVIGQPVEGSLDLSTVDDGLPPLPDGYSESRIILMPRDPQWAYAYWDTPNAHKAELRSQGGERLALRLYDVTDIDLNQQAAHSMQQFDCDELARQWYLSIPISDRDYQAEIGYLTGDGRWLVLARSNTVRIPPVYPSDWNEDHFMTISWEETLRDKALMTLVKPRSKGYGVGLHEQLYALSQPSEWDRLAGSMFGSMHHIPASMAPGQGVSSYVFASGIGMAALPTLSGSIPTLSGIGFSASIPPLRPRKFWLVADAELIVYGATEPDATVTIQGQPIQLSPEGTFRFQTTFPDGHIEYPIMAVAADGEQNRSIHMTFDRQTPERRTNTREEAQEEWPQDS